MLAASDVFFSNKKVLLIHSSTWGDFMQHAVTQAIENALEDDKTFREGLPVNNVSFLGTGKVQLY